MRMLRSATLVASFALCVAGSTLAWSASPDKATALAQQIESGLSGLGCTASVQDDTSSIQSTIAASGATPTEARAALKQVLISPNLCADAETAAHNVDQTIEAALGGDFVPHAGGQGGGSPLGVPATFVSGGGSDYLVH
jgi:hypothetical protein